MDEILNGKNPRGDERLLADLDDEPGSGLTDEEYEERLALKADCEGDELDEDDPGYWPENGPRPR